MVVQTTNDKGWWEMPSLIKFILLLSSIFISLLSQPLWSAPALDNNSVLILGSTVTGGASSVEATQAKLSGFSVEVAGDAEWAAKTQVDFASYRAIILGDPTCRGGTSSIAAADANKTVWGAAVTGNVIVIGSDPVYHQFQGGTQVTARGIEFAADAPTTGAYITLSCYYYNAVSGTPAPCFRPLW